MFTNTITGKTVRILKKFSGLKTCSKFFLVGGTGLSLQIGHRYSDDLDFFSAVEFKSTLAHDLKVLGELEPIGISDNSIEVVVASVKLMLMYWAYPLQYDVIKWQGINLADPRDIGLMKLLCLQGRSTRKDLIDLYFIDKDVIELAKLLALFDKLYPKDSFNTYSSLKNLLNIDDLEKDMMPKMIKTVKWEEAYETIRDKLKKYVLKYVKE